MRFSAAGKPSSHSGFRSFYLLTIPAGRGHGCIPKIAPLYQTARVRVSSRLFKTTIQTEHPSFSTGSDYGRYNEAPADSLSFIIRQLSHFKFIWDIKYQYTIIIVSDENHALYAGIHTSRYLAGRFARACGLECLQPGER